MQLGGGVMRDYLVSFAMTSLFVALASVLSPDGKIKRSVSLALSVILISALTLPLVSTLGSLDDVNYNLHIDFDESQNGEIVNEDFESTTERAINEGLRKAVCERFDIEKDCVSVEARIDIIGSELVFSRVEIYLSGTGVLSDLPRIKKYIEGSLGTECEVYLVENKQSYS